MLVLDTAVGVRRRCSTLLTLWSGPGGSASSGGCGTVGSLGEPAGGRADAREPRPVGAGCSRFETTCPTTFTAEPAEFVRRASRPKRRPCLSYRFVPRRRGTYRFERVDALVSSRLGFWQRRSSLAGADRGPGLSRHPPDRPLHVLARRDRLSTLGVRRSRRLGTDNEFERLRDYIEGDEPRHMDWRATARRRKLTVRAHQVNQSQRIIFLIDCGRMMAGDTGGGLSPLDHAFNAMLMLAHVALIRGDQVGLLAFSDRVRAYVPPGGGAGGSTGWSTASTTSSPSWSSRGTTARSSSWRSGAASGRWSC